LPFWPSGNSFWHCGQIIIYTLNAIVLNVVVAKFISLL
jgi:hypothetical protein